MNAHAHVHGTGMQAQHNSLQPVATALQIWKIIIPAGHRSVQLQGLITT